MTLALHETESEEALFAAQPDLHRLLWVLSRAQGFALYFARCNLPTYRNRLMQALQTRLARPIIEIDLAHGEAASLDARVAQALDQSPPQTVAFLYNLEALLPSSDPARQLQTMQELNWRRGAFSRLERPLVFWLPEYALTALARNAPDFFDWYSGVYEFDVPAELRAELAQITIQSLREEQSTRWLSPDERRRWADVLQELVAEEDGQMVDEQQVQVEILIELGSLNRDQGGYTAAQKYFEQALRIAEKVYGSNHPTVAGIVNGLGLTRHSLGDLTEARAHFERALKIYESAYGSDHPMVAFVISNLGNVLRFQGDLAEARALYERALAINIAVYGQDHPKVAGIIYNLGGVLEAQEDWVSARAYYEQALRIDMLAYGSHHHEVALDLNNLGNVSQAQGDLVGAHTYFEQALKIAETVYGPNHPIVAGIVNNLGSVSSAQGDLTKARAYFEQALRIWRKFLGEDHPSTKITRDNLNSLLDSGAEGVCIGDVR